MGHETYCNWTPLSLIQSIGLARPIAHRPPGQAWQKHRLSPNKLNRNEVSHLIWERWEKEGRGRELSEWMKSLNVDRMKVNDHFVKPKQSLMLFLSVREVFFSHLACTQFILKKAFSAKNRPHGKKETAKSSTASRFLGDNTVYGCFYWWYGQFDVTLPWADKETVTASSFLPCRLYYQGSHTVWLLWSHSARFHSVAPFKPSYCMYLKKKGG